MQESEHHASLSQASRESKNNTSISECPESFAQWYCLNGATCFAVRIYDSTLYNCWCATGFHGLRCEYKYIAHRAYHKLAESLSESFNQASSALSAASDTKPIEDKSPPVFITRQEAGPRVGAGVRQQAFRLSSLQLVTFTLVMLAFIVVLVVLVLSVSKRRPSLMKGGSAWLAGVTSRRVANNKAAHTPFRRAQKNKQINHDRVSIRLDLPKQRPQPSAPSLSLKVSASEQEQHLNQVNVRANLAVTAVQDCFCTASALGLQCEHQQRDEAQEPPTSTLRASPHWMSLEIADELTANDYGAVCG